MVLEKINVVKDREKLALDSQKEAQNEAKNIVQAAQDEAKKLVDAVVKTAIAESELRIAEAKKVSEETLVTKLKKVDDEIKKMLHTVKSRKKLAIQSIIELVMD